MGVRSSIAGSLTRAAKAFGGPAPATMREAAENVSEMGPTSPFSPGEPIGPYDGYSRTPRSHNYVTGTNIATRPRTHERVSFETLRGLVESYDIAQLCIWHRIDSIRSLDWKLIAVEGYSGDVSDAIARGAKALKKPDGIHSFSTWLAKYLYDILAYDAGCLYRMRNRAGRPVGLAPVDGTTIAPLLDYWGNPPAEPAEAYVQYVNGLPWNWLTRGDLIYEPFRARSNSVYGQAPLETIILNANTDIRFQVYFLQRFTDGNIPAAFASAPESWAPDVIEQWQNYWDGFAYGDQAAKSQVKWIPGGSSFAWSNEKDFTDAFSLFLMRKTAAAYHVVPSDLGFTETVNLSSSESQSDVQHRTGELPLDIHVEGVLNGFLQDDLGLPVQFMFDRGEEQEDQAAQAQADGAYIDRGVVSPSEIREMRYGLSEPAGQQVPRYIFTARSGPVPLSSLYGVAGPIDPQTAAPDPGAPLPQKAFLEVEGVVPNPPLIGTPLAEQEFGPSALPAAPAPQPGTVAKEGGGGPGTAGITSATGIVGYDGPGDDDEDDREALAKSELAAFRRFEKTRRRAGEWRDFRFEVTPPVAAHNLNDAGRLAVRKAAGEVAVAGLAVQAQDTGRVLMLQRALTDADPAGGTWEMPGGHLENGETPLQGAWREWAEETAAIPPPGVQGGMWTSPDGIYQGIVWTVPSESDVPVRSAGLVSNPDDPDGDASEAIAWWNPADLPGNPVVRPELLADIDAVMAALGGDNHGDCCGAECCAGGCCNGDAGCTCGGGMVAKAADGPSKWPGWRLADKAAAYWAPLIAAAAGEALTRPVLRRLAADYLAAFPGQQGTAPGKRERNDAACAWLEAWLTAAGITLGVADLAAGVVTDGYLIGAISAAAMVDGGTPDAGDWKPGDTDAAQARVAGLDEGDALAALLTLGAAAATAAITAGVLHAVARALAGAAGTATALAAVLAGVLGDSDLAGSLTLDQIYSSAGTAALDYYPGRSTGDFAWVTDPTLANCAICLGNEASEPRPLGDPWPSGDTTVSIHFKCGCALIPS